jgi:hypothetical protein
MKVQANYKCKQMKTMKPTFNCGELPPEALISTQKDGLLRHHIHCCI